MRISFWVFIRLEVGQTTIEGFFSFYSIGGGINNNCLHQMFFLGGALLTVSPHFQYQNEKLLAQPTRIFPTLKISFFAIFLLRIWRNSSKNISRAISLTLTDILTYFYSSGSLHRDVQQPMLVPAGGLNFLNFTNCHIVIS